MDYLEVVEALKILHFCGQIACTRQVENMLYLLRLKTSFPAAWTPPLVITAWGWDSTWHRTSGGHFLGERPLFAAQLLLTGKCDSSCLGKEWQKLCSLVGTLSRWQGPAVCRNGRANLWCPAVLGDQQLGWSASWESWRFMFPTELGALSSSCISQAITPRHHEDHKSEKRGN